MIITKQCALELGNALLDAASELSDENDSPQVLLKTDEGQVFHTTLIDDDHDQGFQTIMVIQAA